MSPAASTSAFAPVPSVAFSSELVVGAATSMPSNAQVTGVLVGSAGPVPETLGVDRATLDAVGFTGEVGSVQLLLLAWIVLYAAWFLLGIPLGPDSPIKL